MRQHAGWGKSRCTVVHMENNTVINKNKLFHVFTAINLVLPYFVYAGDLSLVIENNKELLIISSLCL